ncbi:MAG: hypothetical protein ACYDEY_01910 [Acidimicrobiales bacterium]
MRRVLSSSKISLVVAGVILALFGTMVWFTLQGTSDLTPKLTAAALTNAPIARAAYALAGGPTATSYRGVTLNAIAKYVTNPEFVSANGFGVAKVILTKGAVTGSSYFPPVKRHGMQESPIVAIVSVDLCADGSACQEIVVATKGLDGNCLYERQTIGNRAVARKEHLRIGYEYAESSQPTCKASNAPRFGWTPGLPM